MVELSTRWVELPARWVELATRHVKDVTRHVEDATGCVEDATGCVEEMTRRLEKTTLHNTLCQFDKLVFAHAWRGEGRVMSEGLSSNAGFAADGKDRRQV